MKKEFRRLNMALTLLLLTAFCVTGVPGRTEALIKSPKFSAAPEQQSASPLFTETVSDGALLAPPVNDNFAAATTITGGTGSTTGTNIEATAEAGEPTHAGGVPSKSVWYKWTENISGYNPGKTFTLRHNATTFDTRLAVYTGTSLNNLTLVAASDDYGATPTSTTSTVFFLSSPSTTYYIAVDGFGGANGNFTLSWDVNRTYASSNRFHPTGFNHVTVFRPSTGAWYSLSSSGFQSRIWGQAGDIPAPADFDGDLITDFAVFRPSTGAWYVLRSATNTLQAINFGQNGDKPVPGDYSKDGYADFAVFRPSTGTWYVSNGFTLTKAAQFGQSGDKPVQMDYDCDGSLDFAVYRPSNGFWYILNSRDNSFRAQGWGISEDIPVPGTYIATGRADIAVWRPSTGTWYVLRTYDNSISVRQWGQSGDIPQPIDHSIISGGLSDLGVFRPSTGTWYIFDYTSGTGSSVIQFGQAGDIPVSTAYPIQQ